MVALPLTNWRLLPAAVKGALQEQLFFLTGLQSMFLEKFYKRGVQFSWCPIEGSFNGALISLSTDKGAVGPFAQNEIKSTNQDRFAGTGLTANGVIAVPQAPK